MAVSYLCVKESPGETHSHNALIDLSQRGYGSAARVCQTDNRLVSWELEQTKPNKDVMFPSLSNISLFDCPCIKASKTFMFRSAVIAISQVVFRNLCDMMERLTIESWADFKHFQQISSHFNNIMSVNLIHG